MNILIVEDNKKLGFYIKKALETEKYSAVCVNDGREALDYILSVRDELDFIILDIMLPRVSGIEICRKIRTNNVLTPVLLLTAKDTDKDKVIGLDSGADDYLTKPFSINELLARIRSHTRRMNLSLTEMIMIDNIKINPSAMKVYKNDKEVELTLLEYELLKYLVSHPNEVLDRERIIEHVWDMNKAMNSNIVDVHIKDLRKKLFKDSPVNRIETIWGIGYRFNK